MRRCEEIRYAAVVNELSDTMLQSQVNMPEIMLHIREALIRGLIWAFIGVLYGMLFVFFAALVVHWELPMHPYFLTGVLSGTIDALIYSSMRLAV